MLEITVTCNNRSAKWRLRVYKVEENPTRNGEKWMSVTDYHTIATFLVKTQWQLKTDYRVNSLQFQEVATNCWLVGSVVALIFIDPWICLAVTNSTAKIREMTKREASYFEVNTFHCVSTISWFPKVKPCRNAPPSTFVMKNTWSSTKTANLLF